MLVLLIIAAAFVLMMFASASVADHNRKIDDERDARISKMYRLK